MECLPYDCLRRISYFLDGEWYTLLFVSKYIRLSHVEYINTRYIGYMSISNAAIRSGNVRWLRTFNTIWRQSRASGSTKIIKYLKNENVLDVIKDINNVEMIDYVANKLYPNGLTFYTGEFCNVRMYKRRLILPRLLVRVAPFMILKKREDCVRYLIEHGLCDNCLPLKVTHILTCT